MVRDEERRKIAKKLRAGAEYLPNDMYSDDLELELAKTVCGYDTPSVDVLFNRLADLIEPEPERTCEMVDNGRELCCSVCDWRHDYDDEPVYCSGCGAKVVG